MRKCAECGREMEKASVSVENAEASVWSFQCIACGHIEFEPETAKEVISELRSREEGPALEMEQKIVKLSHGRLGIYFNRHWSGVLLRASSCGFPSRPKR